MKFYHPYTMGKLIISNNIVQKVLWLQNTMNRLLITVIFLSLSHWKDVSLLACNEKEAKFWSLFTVSLTGISELT